MTDHAVLIQSLVSDKSEEIFLIDANSLRLVAASKAVCQRFKASYEALQGLPFDVLLGLDMQTLTALVQSLSQSAKLIDAPQSTLVSRPAAEQASLMLGLLKLSMRYVDDKPYVLISKTSPPPKPDQTLIDNRSRLKLLVENAPGLVFEFQLNTDNQIQFNYLNASCQALLGHERDTLEKSPDIFLKMIEQEDRDKLFAGIAASAANLSLLNWDGRVWIEAWQDIKWINLRSMPTRSSQGNVQWVGIMTNITQSKKERDELSQSRQRMADLSAHLTQVKEEERSRIAREIHDDLGGNLTVIKLGLASLLKKLPPDQPALIEKTQQLEAIVDATFETAHRISGDLRPNILELGIVEALQWQTKEFEKQIDIPCYFVSNQDEIIETEEQAIALFRICQEAMSNIAKYAQASRVDVALIFNQKEIKMLITDDGIGINASDILKPNSFGLRGMVERVTVLNGHFSIERASKKGTNITVTLPLTIENSMQSNTFPDMI